MNDTASVPSNRLDAAQDRLARAIGRLEAAVENRTRTDSADTSVELDGQLKALQVENAELRSLMGTTADRLDTTIAKFKTELAG